MNPLSLQLYTLSPNTEKDFAGTVQEVAKIGYKAVELAGTGNLNPADAAKAIEDAGLRVSGMHVGLEWMTDKYDELIENATRFKTTELIVPGINPENYASKKASLALGEKLGPVGAKLRADGFRLSYHNHDKEFALFDGRPALEWMLDSCAPQDVSAELDLFWIGVAGQDPLRAVARLGQRARLLHIKDGNGKQQTDVGKGGIDFPAIFKFSEENDLAEWYVVEQEVFDKPRMDCVRVAYDYLASLGKA